MKLATGNSRENQVYEDAKVINPVRQVSFIADFGYISDLLIFSTPCFRQMFPSYAPLKTSENLGFFLNELT